jgi:hypothetical protein
MLALCSLVMIARAQGVESPPVTSFKPDSAMPSVNVPEFVITGRAHVELPKADKPTVDIDSTYFQNRELPGVEVNVPVNRSLSEREKGSNTQPSSLFARVSMGRYSTADYLVSGNSSVSGLNINGSVSGNYTAGFIPNTISRDFSIDGGISRDINVEGGIKSSNSMNLGYTRSAYSLYGGPLPVIQRSTNETKLEINSDMFLGELPLAFALNFDRFALADDWDNTQSSLKLKASSQIQLPSGWIGLKGIFLFGDHTLSASSTNPILLSASPFAAPSLNRSIYDFAVGASYGNTFLLGSLSFSLGVTYFQYRDDSSSTVAKIYPDVRANYRISDMVSLFAGFNGTVRDASLSEFLSTDRYINGLLSIINTQDNAHFTLGSTIAFDNGLRLTPSFDLRNSKYLPMFISDQTNESRLVYAGKATTTTFSLRAEYLVGAFSSGLTLQYQKGTADSLSSIPNLPPFDIELATEYRITPQVAASAKFLFLSTRFTDLALSNKLDPAGLLDVRVSYDFDMARLPMEIFVGGNNILDQKYFVWQGYQEFPLTLYIGVSSRIL